MAKFKQINKQKNVFFIYQISALLHLVFELQQSHLIVSVLR